MVVVEEKKQKVPIQVILPFFVRPYTRRVWMRTSSQRPGSEVQRKVYSAELLQKTVLSSISVVSLGFNFLILILV